jgi:hypothetical protein
LRHLFALKENSFSRSKWSAWDPGTPESVVQISVA